MGGAKNCPETPRQKMIGMMYLVLTAMLALNVSTDILNGFKMVDKSLHSSIDAAYSRNQKLYSEFKVAHDDNPEKTQEMYERALELHSKADALYEYIQGFKTDIAIMADGEKKVQERIATDENGDPTRDIQGQDNRDVTGTYALINVAEDGRTNGEHLRENISAYREFLCAQVHEHDPHLEAEYRKLFATDTLWNDHEKRYIKWEEGVFSDMPVCASVTILTKIQNDIRAAEGQLVQYLMQRTDAADLRVNKFEAYVIPESDYVLRGGHYRAQIVLAAVDSTKAPQYFVDGHEIGPDGMYDIVCSSAGTKTVKGYLTFLDNEGKPLEVPFEHDYVVGEPSATVSNVEMCAIYADYNNQYNVSVPGVPAEKVRVQVENGKITQDDKKGHIIVRPTVKPGGKAKTKIIVMADVDGSGKLTKQGEYEYDVKALPDAKGTIKLPNGREGGSDIPGAVLGSGQCSVNASYGEDVLLKLDFTVVSFQTEINGRVERSEGSKFSDAQLKQIKKLKKGSAVWIQNIQYKPKQGGQIKTLPQFAIKIA